MQGDPAPQIEARSLDGKFVLVAGSAASTCPPDRLALAHLFVRSLVRAIVDAGGGIVVFVSQEPTTPDDRKLPLTFDWIMLRELEHVLTGHASGGSRVRAVVVTSQKAVAHKLSDENRALLSRLSADGRIKPSYIDDAVHSGGKIVSHQIAEASCMIALGGGKGVHVRADEMLQKGRPVLPLDLDIGSMIGDGTGAVGLHSRLATEPQRFFAHTHAQVRMMLPALSLATPGVDVTALAGRIVGLLEGELRASMDAASLDVLVLTAIPIEWEAVRRAFGVDQRQLPERTKAGTNFVRTSVHAQRLQRPCRVVLTCIAGAGNIGAAGTVAEMIAEFHPAVVAMVGIAAGHPDKCKLGEVKIAERVICYEPAAAVARDSEHKTLARPDQVATPHAVQQDIAYYLSPGEATDQRLHDAFTSLGGKFPTDSTVSAVTQMRVRSATIASGEKLLRDATKWDELRRLHDKIEVVEMEGAGVAITCDRLRVPFLIVRGISDFGNEKKDDRYHTIAATAAAVVVADYVREAMALTERSAG